MLVGAAVDIRYTLDAGFAAIGMIFLALAFRSAGVALCMFGTPLTWKERLFCIIAYPVSYTHLDVYKRQI